VSTRFIHSFLIYFLLVPLNVALAQQQKVQSKAADLPLKVIVLNLDEIRRQATVVTNIRDQIANYRTGFQAGIQNEEDALRAANKELAKKRTILSPEAFAKERRQFEQRVIGVQKLVQRRKRQLDQAQVDAMFLVEKQLNKIISDIAQKRQASIVLRRNQTILVARDLDVTAEALARLNKELSQVPVKKPTN
tara:strand:- start:1301 stop:1876 length:576 start_codon:yes stop_codon:yes gene_type:complete